MRLTDFWARVDEAFGAQGQWIARDHVFASLQQRTIREALDAGEDARDVWLAVHAEMKLPAKLR